MISMAWGGCAIADVGAATSTRERLFPTGVGASRVSLMRADRVGGPPGGEDSMRVFEWPEVELGASPHPIARLEPCPVGTSSPGLEARC